MTIAEAQAERAILLTTINRTLAGGAQSYGINGRTKESLPLGVLYKRLGELDALIDRLSNGGGAFYASQFRKPE